MQILRKLTIKTCGDFTIARIKKVLQDAAGYEADGKPKDIPDGTSVDLLKIAGEVTRAKSGQTDKGEFTRLDGSFVGTDLTTGELYQSGACILPQFIGAQLGAAVLGANGGTVEFAFKVAAKAKANTITGYEFAVHPLMDSKPSDSMQRLMALAGIEKKAPALPAPDAPKADESKSEESKPAAKSAKK